MSARPTHDLVIKVGEYNDRETGETKARWLTIGTVFRHDEGGPRSSSTACQSGCRSGAAG